MTITDSDLLYKYTELCEKYADLANKLVNERARSAKLVECLEAFADCECDRKNIMSKTLSEYRSEEKP